MSEGLISKVPVFNLGLGSWRSRSVPVTATTYSLQGRIDPEGKGGGGVVQCIHAGQDYSHGRHGDGWCCAVMHGGKPRAGGSDVKLPELSALAAATATAGGSKQHTEQRKKQHLRKRSAFAATSGCCCGSTITWTMPARQRVGAHQCTLFSA